MKQTSHSIRFLLLSSIGALTLLVAILVSSGVYSSWQDLKTATLINENSFTVNLLYEANQHLSEVRGAGLSILYAPPQRVESLKHILKENWTQYNEKISKALSRIERMDVEPPKLIQVRMRHKKLLKIYEQLNLAISAPKSARDDTLSNEIFQASTSLIEKIGDLALSFPTALERADAVVAMHRLFKHSSWQLAEYAGQEYAMLGRLIVEQKPPTPEQKEELISLRERISYSHEILVNFPLDHQLAKTLAPFLEEADTHYFLIFKSIKEPLYDAFIGSKEAFSYPLNINTWLELSTQAVDTILALENAVIKASQEHLDRLQLRTKRQIITSLMLFIFAVLLSLYCWSIVILRVSQPVNSMINALYKATKGEEYASPPIKHNNDEIGKLAEVLEVFQENTRKIKRSNEELEQFAYIASHDLRAPLRGIDNLAQWIEEDLKEVMTKDTQEKIDLMKNRVSRLENLLDDILQYSRAGRIVDEPEDIDTKKLVESIADNIENPEKFAIKIQEDMPVISAPYTPLEQIFTNLLINAVKHHDKDQGSIDITAIDTGAFYEFVVQDDGPGIPEEFHDRVFKMFQTLQSRDKKEGSGLGMAIIKKLVEWQGGKVWIVSQDGKRGTAIHFTWPKNITKVRKKNAA